VEQPAVWLWKVKRQTVAAYTFCLHPGRTPRVGAQPLQRGIRIIIIIIIIAIMSILLSSMSRV